MSSPWPAQARNKPAERAGDDERDTHSVNECVGCPGDRDDRIRPEVEDQLNARSPHRPTAYRHAVEQSTSILLIDLELQKRHVDTARRQAAIIAYVNLS